MAFTGRTPATDEKAGARYLNSRETPIYFQVPASALYNVDKANHNLMRPARRTLTLDLNTDGSL